MEFEVRLIIDKDVNEIINIFRKNYGDNYPYREFYKPDWVLRGIYNKSLLWLVAAEKGGGKILASASLILEAGDHDDLMGEFGRLVTDPDLQKSGIGRILIETLAYAAEQRLEFGFGEARVVHLGSQKIMESLGFTPLGFEPLKFITTRRENTAVYGKLFGHAKELRNNRILIVPEVEPLAKHVINSMNLETDFNVDDYVGRYPIGKDLELFIIDELSMPRLLRIEMGRVSSPEIFGNLHINYGFFKITEQNAQYLVANKKGKPVGAIGYIHDYIDDKVKIFEMVAKDDFVKGYLIDAIDAYIISSLRAKYIEIDVSAYSPRIQKTFLELGYYPIVYFPSMVFQDIERLDVVRFAKVNAKYDLGKIILTDKVKEVFNIVDSQFK